jgi:hypothetical protein
MGESAVRFELVIRLVAQLARGVLGKEFRSRDLRGDLPGRGLGAVSQNSKACGSAGSTQEQITHM